MTDIDLESFTDGSAFTLLFNSDARVRILDVFLSRGSLRASRERLAELAEVEGDELTRHLELLEDIGFIESNPDSDSDAILYSLKQESDLTNHARDFHLFLSEHTERLQDTRSR